MCIYDALETIKDYCNSVDCENCVICDICGYFTTQHTPPNEWDIDEILYEGGVKNG